MKKGTVVILIAVVAAGFYVLGGLAKKGGANSDKVADSAEKVNQYDNPQFVAIRNSLTAELNGWKQRYSA